jgi:hypothetical protein
MQRSLKAKEDAAAIDAKRFNEKLQEINQLN